MTTNAVVADAPATPRVAIVTGGSGGIGRATALRLAADGMAVVVHYSGNKEKAEETVKAITAAGGNAVAMWADITDEAPVDELFENVEQLFGGVDVVAHTAGIQLRAPLAETSVADFDRQHRTNVRGTFLVSRQAARRLRRGGALITCSTTTTRLQLPKYGSYIASKAAVEAMTLVLARELHGRDITVNAIAPGATATPLFLEDKSPERLQQIADMSPLRRLGEPEDIAECVAFLAGPGRWVNGQVLFVNGGMA
ncbi:SDR family oxidoreductase [Streptomyces sp.]|uniref:SDR family oxidoreductase n=1 Tax=Streptomyces sp. TaxID=1931 RepID=UPI002D77F6A6|nr:SDR family oxidoreductase [Streptomyces sp.]HET6358869.1 SDR family oxidoreductase [Streptomyces sp.]